VRRDKCGRVETIRFPFTDNPWLNAWTITPEEPFWLREVSGPFNYPFLDSIPKEV
jgi:hypothetical protein